MLSATEMRSLPECFTDIDDPAQPAPDGAIPCRASSRWRVPRRCAARAATRRLGSGSMHSDTKPSNGSGSGDATACAHLRAAPPSAICSYVSTPSNSTARSSAGTTNTGGTTQRWPSTARRYARHRRQRHTGPRHERRRPSHQGHLHPKRSASSPAPTTRPNAPTRSAPSSRCSTNSTPSPAKPSPPTLC